MSLIYLLRRASICLKMLFSLDFDKSVTDGPIDGATDGWTDRLTL